MAYSLATTSSSRSVSLHGVAAGVWFGDVGDGSGLDIDLGHFVGVYSVLGCDGTKTDRGPCSGVRSANAVDTSFFSGGRDAAKPAAAPPCVGIGDCIEHAFRPVGPPKKDKNITLNTDCTGMEHLGGIGNFYVNISKFGDPKRACTIAPLNFNQNSNQTNMHENSHSTNIQKMHGNHKSHPAPGDRGGAFPSVTQSRVVQSKLYLMLIM